RAGLPELPWELESRFVSGFGLPPYDAAVLSQDCGRADYFEKVAGLASANAASNWVMGEALGRMNARGWTLQEWERRVTAVSLGELVRRVENKELTGPLAKQALDAMADEGVDAVTVLE